MAVLELEGITKRFGQEVAVSDLSLTIERGEFRSLLGPSGCGKTTTLRCVAGLERPDDGRVILDGERVFDAESNLNVNPEDRDVGMVFQSYAVWPHMTVQENVSFPLEMRDVPKAEREEQVAEALKTVDLDKHAGDLGTNLSGGQQQRVAIARALTVEPKIILFDEPLASLDAKLRREMRMEIKQICDEFDITVLYVTHSQDEAMFLSDNISIMSDGEIVEEGRPTKLHEDPNELFSMEFMGHTNSFSSRVAGMNGSAGATVESPIGEMRVDNVQDGIKEGQDAVVTIRPKLIDLNDSRGGENVFTGTVQYIAPTRDFTEYEIETNGATITVKTATPEAVSPGDEIRYHIDPGAAKIWRQDLERTV